MESAHYLVSEGMLQVQLEDAVSWLDTAGIYLTDTAESSTVTGTVSYENRTISIVLGDAKKKL